MSCGGVVTASIGVATFETNTLPIDPDALIAKADEMLYEAKRSGRNRVVTWPPQSTPSLQPDDRPQANRAEPRR
jgi:predicted signal transduction protein with EAL and GGDEF domain